LEPLLANALAGIIAKPLGPAGGGVVTVVNWVIGLCHNPVHSQWLQWWQDGEFGNFAALCGSGHLQLPCFSVIAFDQVVKLCTLSAP
jgi:hypothetical protein